MRKRKIPVTPLVALIVNVVHLDRASPSARAAIAPAPKIAFVLMATAGFVGLCGDVKRRRRRGLPRRVRPTEPVDVDVAGRCSRLPRPGSGDGQ